MNKIKKIGMILERDFPPDDRPEKEAASLIEAGYEVHMLCFTWQDRPAEEIYKGIHIRRFKIARRTYKKLSPTYLVLPFYKKIWQPQIERFVREKAIDIIHIHDLPMTDIVIKTARKYNCKVICDQHEYWSSWIVNTAHYNTFAGRIVRVLGNWEKYERNYLKQADVVITVTEPLRQCYISAVGLDPQKIITIPNTPSRAVFRKENIIPEIVKRYTDHFVLFYAGAIDILRGLDVVLDSLNELNKVIPGIKFVLAGRISKNYDILKRAREKKVDHLVEFVGWLDVSLLPSYIEAADICLFTPYSRYAEINNTIATKIYQYLAMHKPIVTSYAKMMHDFVVENGLGYAIDPHKPAEFTAKVSELYRNYETRAAEIKENSQKLIDSSPVFWDQTVQPMLQAYAKLK